MHAQSNASITLKISQIGRIRNLYSICLKCNLTHSGSNYKITAIKYCVCPMHSLRDIYGLTHNYESPVCFQVQYDAAFDLQADVQFDVQRDLQC